MKSIEFLREGLKNLKTVGTVARSSRHLCKGMIKHVNFQDARLIVELGAGDGVITKHILKSMHPDATLLAFEVHPKFCESLRKIKDKRLIIAEDSAEKLGEYLERIGATEVDFFISAIPFVALPKELGYKIVSICHKYLRKSGLYIQVHYSLLTKSLYETVFGNVDVNFVPLNVPPAFVLVSEKH
ncbi:MAG: methyltransferase [Phaeodactylibacter sp.]|nr:methyltransferase [Phaeodactylibacter sp.]MCB9263828.1 methyltransferase [Lewinellaceae bacterium]MCB9288251.1 methyltransferase [Lewinellaceae bacterium]